MIKLNKDSNSPKMERASAPGIKVKKYNIKDVVVGSIIKTNGTGEVAPFVKDNSMHTQPIEQEKDIIDSLSKVCKVYTKSIHVLDNFK